MLAGSLPIAEAILTVAHTIYLHTCSRAGMLTRLPLAYQSLNGQPVDFKLALAPWLGNLG